MRHHFRTQLCLLLILALTVLACAETFTGDGGVSLKAPKGWTSGKNIRNTVLVLFAPQKLPNFHPNVNIMIQNTNGMSDDEFKAITDEQLAGIGGRSWDYKAVALPNNVKGRCLNIEFTHGGQKLASLSVWVRSGKKTYLFTGTTTPEDFPKRRAEFLKIAQTMRLP